MGPRYGILNGVSYLYPQTIFLLLLAQPPSSQSNSQKFIELFLIFFLFAHDMPVNPQNPFCSFHNMSQGCRPSCWYWGIILQVGIVSNFCKQELRFAQEVWGGQMATSSPLLLPTSSLHPGWRRLQMLIIRGGGVVWHFYMYFIY